MEHWFDVQLRERMRHDQQSMDRAFADLSSVVMGDGFRESFLSDRERTRGAVDEILHSYGLSSTSAGEEDAADFEEYLDAALHPAGVMRRRVMLHGAWYRDAIGPMLGKLCTSEVVALLPKPFGGYTYRDPQSGQMKRISRRNATLLQEEGYCFYKPLAQKTLTTRDLLRYMVSLVRVDDLILFLGISLLVTLLGFFSPVVNQLLFGQIIPSGNEGLLLPTLVLLVSFAVGTQLLTMCKGLITQRLRSRVAMAIQPASMARVLTLPVSFFRKYNSGELSSRIASMSLLCESLIDAFCGTFISALFSLLYLFQIGNIAGSLVLPAVVTLTALLILNTIVALLELKRERVALSLGARLNGLVFALFGGVGKIRLTGAEKRGFAQWAAVYREEAKHRYDPPALIKYGGVLNSFITSAGLLAFYYIATVQHVSVSDYMAFTVSYGMISAAVLSLTGLTTTYAGIKPQLEMVEPLLKCQPETSERKTTVQSVSGAIELSHVSFRYTDDGPDVLHDLDLKIKPHEYVALVGHTGCGKSTLLRLLLGFDKPYKGAVYYDGMDVNRLDLRSLRRHIGVVTQNGKLFPGDLFSNIAISKPGLTLDEAWEAARMAGLNHDIEEMPMGMHTLIGEGSGGLSGGQRQRLMIARALAGKPHILFLDEATSALDNITQRQVADSLDRLNCTRLVIAHRLSTIRACDRILVMEHGQIVESGTFDELVARKGAFYALASRQLLDGGEVGQDSVY